mgnify:CR=1 FL=1
MTACCSRNEFWNAKHDRIEYAWRMCEIHVTEGTQGKLWFVSVERCQGNPARKTVMTGPRNSQQEAIDAGTQLIKANGCDVSRVVITREKPTRGIFG